MEHLAKRLADYICEKEIITEEMTEIYQYGFQCFLELSVKYRMQHYNSPVSRYAA